MLSNFLGKLYLNFLHIQGNRCGFICHGPRIENEGSGVLIETHSAREHPVNSSPPTEKNKKWKKERKRKTTTTISTLLELLQRSLETSVLSQTLPWLKKSERLLAALPPWFQGHGPHKRRTGVHGRYLNQPISVPLSYALHDTIAFYCLTHHSF